MITITSGLNEITLIRNFKSNPSTFKLQNLITKDTYEVDCIDIGDNENKITIQFSYFYPIIGEYMYEVLDVDKNIISKGLAIVEKDKTEVITYEAEKTNIVYEGKF